VERDRCRAARCRLRPRRWQYANDGRNLHDRALVYEATADFVARDSKLKVVITAEDAELKGTLGRSMKDFTFALDRQCLQIHGLMVEFLEH
jgi:hypothetical protein